MKLNRNSHWIDIPIKVQKADSFGTRLLGLMFRREPIKDKALLLQPCNSIHMCFMFFAIDVIFLDQQFRVVKIVECLKPWRYVAPVEKAKCTLELPMGTISRYGIKVGDRINMTL